MNSLKPISSFLFLLALVTAKTALASDPDIHSVFSTGIDDGIRAMAFKTDLYTIQKIKSGFGKP